MQCQPRTKSFRVRREKARTTTAYLGRDGFVHKRKRSNGSVRKNENLIRRAVETIRKRILVDGNDPPRSVRQHISGYRALISKEQNCSSLRPYQYILQRAIDCPYASAASAAHGETTGNIMEERPTEGEVNKKHGLFDGGRERKEDVCFDSNGLRVA